MDRRRRTVDRQRATSRRTARHICGLHLDCPCPPSRLPWRRPSPADPSGLVRFRHSGAGRQPAGRSRSLCRRPCGGTHTLAAEQLGGRRHSARHHAPVVRGADCREAPPVHRKARARLRVGRAGRRPGWRFRSSRRGQPHMVEGWFVHVPGEPAGRFVRCRRSRMAGPGSCRAVPRLPAPAAADDGASTGRSTRRRRGIYGGGARDGGLGGIRADPVGAGRQHVA